MRRTLMPDKLRVEALSLRLGALLRTHRGRMTRFVAVGVANTAVDFAIFATCFYLLGAHLLVANSLGYAAGLANSWVMNSRWTFHDPERRERPSRAALFAAFNVGGLLIANAVIWPLALVLPAWAAKLGATGATVLWNYWSSQRFVFVRD